MTETILTGAVALVFALVHVLGPAMRFLQVTPRSVWLSLAGGVSLSYVFVHLLPELAEHQERSLRALDVEGGSLARSHVYVVALCGLVLFYGLERLVRRAKRPGRGSVPSGLFWINLGSYATYSALVGYLLVHREDPSPVGLAIYAVALGLHFIVNDQGLRHDHGRQYDRVGRWILAAAPLVGWAAGRSTELSATAVASLFAFLAGGIVLNVLKEELPEDRESKFWALATGAVVFTALLLLGG